MFIALDLETTGFDAAADQIIEIAAIKFEGEKIVDTFETLVNPHLPIPAMVSHITGITNDDVQDAPSFRDIEEKFLRFLGDDPIVGHNIPFDITFLQQKGLPIKNPLYDTLIMAGILFPNLPSYSLDTLTRFLKIEHTSKHRAMSDTHASFELFLRLQQKIAEIPEVPYAEIVQILEKTNWPLKTVFLMRPEQKTATASSTSESLSQNQNHVEGTTIAAPEILSAKKNRSETEATTAVSATSNFDLETFYDEKGMLAAMLPDYEKRPTQLRMSELLLEAFAHNKKLLIEAGTGSGKTLAYLVSSVLWSLEHPEKIVLSTYTHTLQQQMLEKDIPMLLKAMAQFNPKFSDSDSTPRIAILKGRKNYLSGHRLELFKKRIGLSPEEIAFLLKVIIWLGQSQSGDLSELHLQNKEKVLVDEICCQEDWCLHQNDDYKADCYLLKARAKAEQADIIIVNHALLLQNELADSPLLPWYEHLIIDEAHHLENVITDSFTLTLSLTSFLKPFVRLEKFLTSKPELLEQLHRIVGRIDIFFGLIGIFLEKEMADSHTDYSLNLMPYHFQSPAWVKVKDAAQTLFTFATEALQTFAQKIGIDDSEQSALPSFENDATPTSDPSAKNAEIRASLADATKKLHDLQQSVLEDNSNRINWLLKSIDENISLKSAPLQIGPLAQDLLFAKRKSVVLTSATLTTNGNFQYLRDQLQLNADSPLHFEEYRLPSHFHYPDQVKIIIPEDLPEPATEGYFLSCCEVISAAIKKNSGRTLVLFTSKKALAATYHQIAPELKKAGFTVLGQNISGGRGKILEHFKDEPDRSALFGTSSFWEGVDLKGDLLTCVIMQKLPFDPPDDPIISARSKKYRNAFDEYQIPRAILRFKQGFGRLIRSSNDTGSIILLDTRILQKSYGPRFLSSLPEGIKIVYSTKAKIAEAL